MPVSAYDVERIRRATDIVALVRDSTALRQVGPRQVGLCPFRAGQFPSFSVHPQEGLYYCFGCHAQGDAISFVRETQGVDLESAVRLLAARAGIGLS